MTKKQNYIFGVGKRKTASARVRLFKGKGQSTVNDKKIEEYFPSEYEKTFWKRPFQLTDTEGKYFVTVKVAGSGKSSQLAAVVHGISKALVSASKDTFRTPLKKFGLLTRDSRERQRRMVGTGGKSRREKQSPKR